MPWRTELAAGVKCLMVVTLRLWRAFPPPSGRMLPVRRQSVLSCKDVIAVPSLDPMCLYGRI